MIELGRSAAVLAADAGGKQGNPESQGPQQASKGAVQFITEAATPEDDDLVEETLFVTLDFASQGDVEVLEGDGLKVGEVKKAQGIGGWRSRSGEGDASEVGGGVHPELLDVIALLEIVL